jgi:hypothetical protein
MRPLFEEIAWGEWQLRDLAGQVAGKKGTYFFGMGVIQFRSELANHSGIDVRGSLDGG